MALTVSVAHAVEFLTQPLFQSYPAVTIGKLALILEANLTAFYAPSWVNNQPTSGSGRRCLTLSPDCLPPRVIYAGCLATGVQWFDWIALLGGFEFDFFVDPGLVSIRVGKKGSPNSRMITVWADTNSTAPLYRPAAANNKKTFAQQLLEDDHEEDNRLFSMLADEIRAPTWMTPVVDRFPASSRSISPVSTISNDSDHSRSSSRSSNSSSSTSSQKLSRRERARQARVYVDTTKVEVTPYDGGKTTVLTGGVMLGGGPKPAASKSNWRRT